MLEAAPGVCAAAMNALPVDDAVYRMTEHSKLLNRRPIVTELRAAIH
jgi:hypothetical protein